MDESNTVVSAYTLYRHLQWYCSHPSIYVSPIQGCGSEVSCPWTLIREHQWSRALNPGTPGYKSYILTLIDTERHIKRINRR